MSIKVLQRRRMRMQPGFNLTPMLDMVFLFALFLYFSHKIRDEAARMDVRLPASTTAAPADEQKLPPSIHAGRPGTRLFQEPAHGEGRN